MQTPHNRSGKKHIRGIYFFTGRLLRVLIWRSSSRPVKLRLIYHNAFICFCNNIRYKIYHQILARIAKPKKTRTTRMHFRRFPTSITAPTSCSNIFFMHSLLICGFLILFCSFLMLSSFFIFGFKEVDVASPLVAHAAASLPSIVLRSALTSIKFLSINKSMYWPSQNQNEHPSSYTKE